jgi:hypothetical protein
VKSCLFPLFSLTFGFSVFARIWPLPSGGFCFLALLAGDAFRVHNETRFLDVLIGCSVEVPVQASVLLIVYFLGVCYSSPYAVVFVHRLVHGRELL